MIFTVLRSRAVCSRIPRRPLSRSFHSSSSRRSYKSGYFRFLDDVPEDTVFWGIIGLNGMVFAMSWWAKKKLEVERNPALWLMMRKNFYSNWKNISEGRIWTLFTSTFTHSDRDLSHILFNGFTYYFLARPALGVLGSRHFLFLYLGGGALAEVGSIAYNQIFRNGRDPYSCGASAALYSVLSFFACLAPTSSLLLYGIIPVPMYVAVPGLFTYDLYRTVNDKGGTVNASAHVGGILAGVGYFLLRRFRVF
ncbi:hypothetical protein C8R43DRAFT_1037553 [Mycena crocata]|nr:hypothetical protein C8R43DRAFT_1037553 [Mycena crocata]